MTNPKTVYGVFTDGWSCRNPPELNKLFFHSSDAEAEAEKLRNKKYDTGMLFYYGVTVKELEIN
jgi:hypothetical protein